MKTKVIAAAAAMLALGLMTNAGLAQDGLPDDPNVEREHDPVARC